MRGGTGREVAMAGSIVVGVDGSEGSKEALRWAARQAELTGAKLRLVMAWESTSIPFYAPLMDGFDLESDTRKTIEGMVQEVLGRPGPDVEIAAVEGSPASTLVNEARGADLLVVGSRGRGEVAGTLLGSVSQHCVTHARCPVVVVHRTKLAAAT